MPPETLVPTYQNTRCHKPNDKTSNITYVIILKANMACFLHMQCYEDGMFFVKHFPNL